MVTVSIVMPTYNQFEFIEASVRSVLNQSLKSLELIIVNDGSTDATADYLSAIDDPRVKIFQQVNQGASAAMNIGFSQAKGQFLTWLASDNLYQPNFLKSCLDILINHPEIGLVYTDFVNMDARGTILDTVRLEDYYPGLLLVDPGAVGVGFLYRREVYERVGDYVDLVCNDLDYWLRAARHWDFFHLPQVMAVNRKHGTMQTVVRRAELMQQVRHRLKEEMAIAPKADPCVMDRFTAFRREAERLLRAIALRVDGGIEAVAVVGAQPLAATIVELLKVAGFRSRHANLDVVTTDNEVCLALDSEIHERLKKTGLPVVRLDCDHTSALGVDF